LHAKFKRAGAVVLGISRDTVAKQEKFKAAQGFPFELLSDADEKVCRSWDTLKKKNMYGKQVMGIERSTFLIGEDGRLLREWRKIKIPGHADEVLAAVKES